MPRVWAVLDGRPPGEDMTTKSTGSDLKDLILVFAAIAIIFAVWLVAVILQVLLDYWYLSIPLIGALLYLVITRDAPPRVPLPAVKTVSIVEDVRINNGTRHTRTQEKYLPEKKHGCKIMVTKQEVRDYYAENRKDSNKGMCPQIVEDVLERSVCEDKNGQLYPIVSGFFDGEPSDVYYSLEQVKELVRKNIHQYVVDLIKIAEI